MIFFWGGGVGQFGLSLIYDLRIAFETRTNICETLYTNIKFEYQNIETNELQLPRASLEQLKIIFGGNLWTVK